LDAAVKEIGDNGSEEFGVEWFPDDGSILHPAFVRLGIAC
jgi:hypothetical protein